MDSARVTLSYNQSTDPAGDANGRVPRCRHGSCGPSYSSNQVLPGSRTTLCVAVSFRSVPQEEGARPAITVRPLVAQPLVAPAGIALPEFDDVWPHRVGHPLIGYQIGVEVQFVASRFPGKVKVDRINQGLALPAGHRHRPRPRRPGHEVGPTHSRGRPRGSSFRPPDSVRHDGCGRTRNAACPSSPASVCR
jgi:hypothetical protein